MTATTAPGDGPRGSVAAIIPVRGGSKGVPRKNLRRVAGIPLVTRAIRTATQAASVDIVVVSTDDAEIAAEARLHGALVVDRPASLASDEAASEDALLHAVDTLEQAGHLVRVVVFLQATSPFIAPEDLDGAVGRVSDGSCDVVFSAVETHAFLWKASDAGVVGVNHDHSFRPRRQDREPQFQETGAFYVMDAEGFKRSRFRFFGRVDMALVDPRTAIEIDEESQLDLADMISRALPKEDDVRIAARALAMDFDGVHTDDRAWIDQNGVESVAVSRSDGMGISMLREAGIPMLILSKEKNPVVSARAAKLGIEVSQGVDAKLLALSDWAARIGVPLSDVAYVGNDINDAECLAAVGWPIAVHDAQDSALRLARVVLERPGGRGAIREVADRMLGEAPSADAPWVRG